MSGAVEFVLDGGLRAKAQRWLDEPVDAPVEQPAATVMLVRDASAPDASAPDASAADVPAPDASVPDVSLPDVSAPDVSASRASGGVEVFVMRRRLPTPALRRPTPSKPLKVDKTAAR